MPNLDGTGPRGEGPKTGLGRGRCVTNQDKDTDSELKQQKNSSTPERLYRNRRPGRGRGNFGLGKNN